MGKFKSGDYVKVINNHNHKGSLSFEHYYWVIDVCNLRDDERVLINDDNDITRWYYSTRFELDIPMMRNVIIDNILI